MRGRNPRCVRHAGRPRVCGVVCVWGGGGGEGRKGRKGEGAPVVWMGGVTGGGPVPRCTRGVTCIHPCRPRNPTHALQPNSQHRHGPEPAGAVAGGKWVPNEPGTNITLRGEPRGPYCRCAEREGMHGRPCREWWQKGGDMGKGRAAGRAGCQPLVAGDGSVASRVHCQQRFRSGPAATLNSRAGRPLARFPAGTWTSRRRRRSPRPEPEGMARRRIFTRRRMYDDEEGRMLSCPPTPLAPVQAGASGVHAWGGGRPPPPPPAVTAKYATLAFDGFGRLAAWGRGVNVHITGYEAGLGTHVTPRSRLEAASSCAGVSMRRAPAPRLPGPARQNC